MHRYLDNIIFYLQRSGGGSVYWGELVKRLNGLQDVSFINPDTSTSNIISNSLKLSPVIIEKLPLKLLRYSPIIVNLKDEGILHSSYYRYTRQKNITNITTVHDFTYEKFGKGIAVAVHHRQKGLAIKHSKKIICISNSTKNDLLTYFPHLLAGKEISVIYNGVSDIFSVIDVKESLKQKLRLSDSYAHVLYIGHRTQYKNFDFAIEVVNSLPINYKLLIVGNPLNSSEQKALDSKLKDRYVFLGNVSNDELNEIYNIAHCLLYPSSYEGFGIPIIEAFKTKCPVVAQDIPVIREVANNAALLNNGLNVKDFGRAIMSLEKDSVKEVLIQEGIVIASRFSWDKCVQETLDFSNI
ncbi:glycosyltransferase family 4 protein [Mucilaginibacter agri]|uniref:Glycosyltransferase n=1 Tax=Mucilaginibacter agri TaxID=2695265 RepID=A0A965ZHE5_9SPHI|nr:glycosyltransferase family 1 protein [Mucilaginibacter agri]NCD70760.1 glycosyltransferase [Mucilaginibacter agri]